MKRIVFGVLTVVAVIAIAAVAWTRTSNTCDTIIGMAGKGATESEMLSAVEKTNRDPLNADDVIKLKHAGVPNTVIFKMIHKSGTH